MQQNVLFSSGFSIASAIKFLKSVFKKVMLKKDILFFE